MATPVKAGLLGEYIAKRAKSYHEGASNADTTTWRDLTGISAPASTSGFAWTEASGWRGLGSDTDPRRLMFDTTDDAVSGLATTEAQDDAGHTWEFWLTCPTLTTHYVLFDHGDSDSNGAFYPWYNGTNCLLYLGGSNYRYWPIPTGYNDGLPHHWVITIPGDQLADISSAVLYFDGAAQTPGATTLDYGHNTWTRDLHLGRSTSYPAPAVGIATVRVYGRDLTASEVAQNYEAGIDGVASEPPTVARQGLVAEYVGKWASTSATFGNTANETGTAYGWANEALIGQFTLTKLLRVSKLTGRISNNDSGNQACAFKGVIYSDSGGEPASLVAVSEEVSLAAGATVAWRDMVFGVPPLLAPGTYWLGFICSSTATGIDLKYAVSGTGGQRRAVADTYSDGPASTWNTATDVSGTWNFAIYASGSLAAPGNNTDPTSTWKDLIHGNDLTLAGFGYTASSGWDGAGTATSPHALVPDASGDYLTMTEVALSTSHFTLEFWFKKVAAEGESTWVGHVTGEAFVGLHDGTSCEVDWDSFGYANNWTLPAMTTGTWHHLVLTRASGVARVYLDATESTTGPLSNHSTRTLTVDRIMRCQATSTYDGENPLATIRRYSRALTATEIAQNYAAGPTAASLQDASNLIAFGVF